MMAETETSAALRPFWGRIMVIPVEGEQHERPSGLLVPSEYEGDDRVKRGIVTHIDPWRAEPIESPDNIGPGAIVYYRGGVKVLDAVVLERHEIFAYEYVPDEDRHIVP